MVAETGKSLNGKGGSMKPFVMGSILFWALVIASPAIMFGRHEFKHNQARVPGHHQSMVRHLNPGDSAFRR